MWVLILFMSALGNRPSVIEAVPGFSYEQACKSAGALSTILDKDMKFICVKSS